MASCPRAWLQHGFGVRHEEICGGDLEPMMDVAAEMRSSRTSHLKTGVWLTAAAVAWNLVAGAIAVAAGGPARSIALVAFGIVSVY
jgi:hypothetical protein